MAANNKRSNFSPLLSIASLWIVLSIILLDVISTSSTSIPRKTEDLGTGIQHWISFKKTR